MALSGKLDEVGEADRWIWERLGHIWERLGCWTGSSQQPRRLIKTQILLAENLLEQGGGGLSEGELAEAGLVMAPLYPILNKRIPRRYLYIGGMISMIVAYVLLVLFYIPGTLIQMTAILSLTDSIEYGQLKNGKRNEAVTLSVRPMLDKIGGALSNGITGFIAVAAGMTGSATAADMTPANIHTFEVCAFYVPLVLIVLSLLVFTFKVKINEKMHAEIVEQLEAKLAAGEISDEEAKTVETVEAINEKAKLTE